MKSALLILLICTTPALAQTREEVVRARAPLVMPFALSATTHVFAKSSDGGVQKVVAKDPANKKQVHLVQAHLAEIAAAFAAGDYSGPATLHGPEMPGLAVLRTAPRGAIAITYSPLPHGGQIVYATRDLQLMNALHAWFDAQLHDHGSDATPHGGHAHQHGH